MDQTKMRTQVHPGFNGKIVLASNRDGIEAVHVMNAADVTAQTRLTDNAVGSFAPTWAPRAIFCIFLQPLPVVTGVYR